jgi:hypothetical protein
MTCFGWLKATEGLPFTTNKYAEEGTAAHELLEMTLRLGLPPTEMTGNLELAMNIATVTDWLSKYRKTHKKSDYHIERWLPWGKVLGHPELGGTADLCVIDPTELIIGDYKNGVGVVEVMDNRQLMLYLLGLIHLYGPRPEYRLVIFQPRARHEDGAVREWPVDHEEVIAFKKEAQRAVEANIKGGERIAGEHCGNYCLAAGNCKAYTLYSLEAAGEEFS